LADEGAAAGSRLDDPEKLKRAQRLAHRRPRHLELLGELTLGRKLIAGPQIALFEQTFDLRDDSLVETAPADRLDDGQRRTSLGNGLWSGGQTRRQESLRRAPQAVKCCAGVGSGAA
jgi:hypothetical protein